MAKRISQKTSGKKVEPGISGKKPASAKPAPAVRRKKVPAPAVPLEVFGVRPARKRSAPPPAASAVMESVALSVSPPAATPGSPVRVPVEPPAGQAAYLDRGMPVPDNYGLDRLVAMVRDPEWIVCYWEFHGPLLGRVVQQRGQAFLESCAWVLRMHRINENLAQDMEINPAVGHWYVNVGRSGKYLFELGLLSPDGEWLSLLVSPLVETPPEGPSALYDEAWRLSAVNEAALGVRMRDTVSALAAGSRGVSGFLGASRLQSSFSVVSSPPFLGGSGSGRPVAGSWGWSFQGASSAMQTPVLMRPAPDGGPNWQVQKNLPEAGLGKTQQAHFKVKLPRVLKGLPLPEPTWPPRAVAAKT